MAKTTILDFGFHQGEGLQDLIHGHLPQLNHDFEVVSFDPVCLPPIYLPPCDFRLIRAAVGAHDGWAQMSVKPHGRTNVSTIQKDNALFGFGTVEMVRVLSPRSIANLISDGSSVYVKIDIEGTEYAFLPPLLDVFGTRILGLWIEPHQENFHGPGGVCLNPAWPSWEELIAPAKALNIPVERWH